MKQIFHTLLIVIGLALVTCSPQKANVTPEEARQIAEEAYIFAFPMIDHYKMMFAMAMYPESGAYTAPFNVLFHNPELSGPKDTIIVRPNNDTFYSAVWFDLSAQPQILKVPEITDGRYYSFQIIDMYTHNIDYVGTRETGFDAGTYLFVGPNWEGEIPEGITKVIQSEGNYVLALTRTQVFGPDDVENARVVMKQYNVQSLNAWLGKAEATVISENPPIPPYHPAKVADENFISYFNALMAQLRIHPTEKELFEKFAKIGIAPGKTFNTNDYSPEILTAIKEGINAGREKFIEESSRLGVRKNGWQLVAEAFGNRDAMQGKYLTRAAAAYFGLWGNDLEEAFYPETTLDADDEELDASTQDYILHFEPDELPPAKAFWSITMYKLPEQLLLENEINRYVIGSGTKGLQYNGDGSLDVYIQKENPGKEKVSNWLPAHDGKFSLQMRIYWPEPESLSPLYVPPAVQKSNN
jgi:hypothetical protein